MKGMLLPELLGLFAWGIWGQFPFLGLSCLCLCEIASIKSDSFFSLLANRKSLAIFVHLRVALLVVLILMIAWDLKNWASLSSWFSGFLLVLPFAFLEILLFSVHSFPQSSLQIKLHFFFFILLGEEGVRKIVSLKFGTSGSLFPVLIAPCFWAQTCLCLRR